MCFRGITTTLIPDNTKAIINDPDVSTPTLVVAFLDYVQARGLFVDPAPLERKPGGWANRHVGLFAPEATRAEFHQSR